MNPTAHPADGPYTWDQPTVRLKQGEMTLFQSLGDPAARSACLVLYSGAEPGQRFALPEGTLSLGRAPDCQVLLDNAAISHQPPPCRTAGAGRRGAPARPRLRQRQLGQ